jgi:hypothetical protein
LNLGISEWCDTSWGGWCSPILINVTQLWTVLNSPDRGKMEQGEGRS